MGINIKEIYDGIFMFRFYHAKDKQILEGGPWYFDNAMLIIQVIPPGE